MEQSISTAILSTLLPTLVESKSITTLTSLVEGKTLSDTRLKSVKHFCLLISPHKNDFSYAAYQMNELSQCFCVKDTCMLLIHQHVPFYVKDAISFVGERKFKDASIQKNWVTKYNLSE